MRNVELMVAHFVRILKSVEFGEWRVELWWRSKASHYLNEERGMRNEE